LQRDLGLAVPLSGSLLDWARQGVLLLNTSLSVEEACPGSHAKLGWQVLTDKIVAAVADHPRPKVFMFWGAHAQAKAPLVLGSAAGARHLVLQCNHPVAAVRDPSTAALRRLWTFRSGSRFPVGGRTGPAGADWRLDLRCTLDEVRVDNRR